jgi:1-Cys peroxiredoxin 6
MYQNKACQILQRHIITQKYNPSIVSVLQNRTFFFSQKMTTFSGRLGEVVPDVDLKTTQGDFKLHDYISQSPKYTILFSHPADYTPVCTTELGKAHSVFSRLSQKGVRCLGLSCEGVDSHHGWIKDILARENSSDKDLSFPIIADEDRSIAVAFGMLDPLCQNDKGVPMPSRALMIFDTTKKLRLQILYPASCGRNFDEVERVIDSLILTDDHQCATPVNWKQGDRVVVVPNVSTEDAKQKFKNLEVAALPSGKEYLRFVDAPNK